MPAAPSTTYQCQIQAGFNQQQQGAQTPYLSLWLPGSSGRGVNHNGQSSNMAQFWVLDDRNPLGVAPQYFIAPNLSTVPAGLAALMDDKHLLVASFVGYGTQTPSGALFDFLMANGAGGTLSALEQMSLTLACGMTITTAYAVVAIPGQGPRSGVEFLKAPIPVTYTSPSQTAWFTMFGFYIFPDPNGGYIPSRSFAQS
jgi:hypothetical protein